ncbi:hypothetical protein [Ferrimonas marina]|uniref:Uncharacterized protein n=1 Tax=Ferrimonas marina TaxID=299255 RepID=A0A1M5U873_9GAMM|nr:hypothetical protein [Ferrimonas marina]SHH59174.1 hypothetical protein SAMN02745129_2449 [Ferrimonas marina]
MRNFEQELSQPALASAALEMLIDATGKHHPILTDRLSNGAVLAGSAVAAAVFHLLKLDLCTDYGDIDCFNVNTVKDKPPIDNGPESADRLREEAHNDATTVVEANSQIANYHIHPYGIPCLVSSERLIRRTLNSSSIGILNLIELDCNHKVTDPAEAIITSFDINACMVALKVTENGPQLVPHPEFLAFLQHRRLEALNLRTPVRTAIRLIKKAHRFGDAVSLDLNQQFDQLAFAHAARKTYLALKAQPFEESSFEYAHRAHDDLRSDAMCREFSSFHAYTQRLSQHQETLDQRDDGVYLVFPDQLGDTVRRGTLDALNPEQQALLRSHWHWQTATIGFDEMVMVYPKVIGQHWKDKLNTLMLGNCTYAYFHPAGNNPLVHRVVRAMTGKAARLWLTPIEQLEEGVRPLATRMQSGQFAPSSLSPWGELDLTSHPGVDLLQLDAYPQGLSEYQCQTLFEFFHRHPDTHEQLMTRSLSDMNEHWLALLKVVQWSPVLLALSTNNMLSPTTLLELAVRHQHKPERLAVIGKQMSEATAFKPLDVTQHLSSDLVEITSASQWEGLRERYFDIPVIRNTKGFGPHLKAYRHFIAAHQVLDGRAIFTAVHRPHPLYDNLDFRTAIKITNHGLGTLSTIVAAALKDTIKRKRWLHRLVNAPLLWALKGMEKAVPAPYCYRLSEQARWRQQARLHGANYKATERVAQRLYREE